MDDTMKQLIKEGVQAEVSRQIKENNMKVTLDHKHLRDVIDNGGSDFVEAIRDNILETSLNRRVERIVANEAKILMDQTIMTAVKKEVVQWFDVQEGKLWPYKATFIVNEDTSKKLTDRVALMVDTRFRKTVRESVDKRLIEMEKRMGDEISTYMTRQGEEIFHKLVVNKLNEFISEILPWKQNEIDKVNKEVST
jgi:hypothetical protein